MISHWRATPIIAVFVAGLYTAGCSPSRAPTASAAGATATVGAEHNPSDSIAKDQYVIGSGDTLSVFVYRNPDLSEGGVAVRPDGRISVPLIEGHSSW